MPMRKSTVFLVYIFSNLILLAALGVHSFYQREGAAPWLEEKRQIIRRLDLTDLCLFTEANYTRHLTQADGHVAFQDHPLSLEHFPSGSLLRPPSTMNRTHVRLDR
jgi:hypothetical protein